MIVVEGKDDEAAVKKAVPVEVITTNGLGITEETLQRIMTAQARCGVIVMTDPDYPGEKIRRIITEAVPGCRHAYLDQSYVAPGKKRIGVEYASPTEIIDALVAAKISANTSEGFFVREDLWRNGLLGQPCSAELRHKVGRRLGLGQANAKQFLNRLNAYGITMAEFEKALEGAMKE